MCIRDSRDKWMSEWIMNYFFLCALKKADKSQGWISRSKGGAMVTALASHQRGQTRVKILASTPSVDWVCCWLACENIRFSSLFNAGDVSRRGTSATQRRKFHSDDANQFLHNNSGSHWFPNINLSNVTCLLVDVGKVLCPSANELQQNYWLFC